MNRAKKQPNSIGIDEVGRGALAGPVTVAAVLCTPRALSNFKHGKFLHPLRDSKRLSARQREWWRRQIHKASVTRGGGIWYTIRSVSPRGIEKTNITRAANQAATRAIKFLSIKTGNRVRRARVVLDGGLFLTQHAHKKYVSNYRCRTIPHGDMKFTEIQLASIIAKVFRDRLLERMDTKHPKYKFSLNKGYGTKMHIRALKKHGASNVHRKTFVEHLL